MIRAIGLAIAIVGSLGGVAHGGQPALNIAIFGSPHVLDLGSDGSAPAFMCLTSEPALPPKNTECFAFEPNLASANKIRLASGGALVRNGTGQGWVESPGGFHFVQQTDPGSRLVLFDASRNIRWIIPQPSGASVLEVKGVAHPYFAVVGVDYPSAPPGRVTAQASANVDPHDASTAPPSYRPVFVRQIDPRLRVDIHSVINNWNRTPRNLTDQVCVDLIAAIAATIGVERPSPVHASTTADYVRELVRLNAPATARSRRPTAPGPDTPAMPQH